MRTGRKGDVAEAVGKVARASMGACECTRKGFGHKMQRQTTKKAQQKDTQVHRRKQLPVRTALAEKDGGQRGAVRVGDGDSRVGDGEGRGAATAKLGQGKRRLSLAPQAAGVTK